MLTIAALFTIYFSVAKSRGKDPVIWGFVGSGIGVLNMLTIGQVLATISSSGHLIAFVLLSLLDILILGYFSLFFISKEGLNKDSTTLTVHDKKVNELVEAVLNEDIHKVRELLDAGANPNEKRQDGYSAIDFARGRSLNEIYKLLSENTA